MNFWHEIVWIDLRNGKQIAGRLIDAVIRNDGSISIDCTCGREFYTVALSGSPTSGTLTGEFKRGKSGRGEGGPVSAARYDGPSAVLLKGLWVEDGTDYLWLAEIDSSKLGHQISNSAIGSLPASVLIGGTFSPAVGVTSGVDAEKQEPIIQLKWNPATEAITVSEVLALYPSLGIPHFQRGLVWGNESVSSLLESLYHDTPCGSFVFWDSGANEGHGVPMPHGDAGGIRYLVVDGQQRIRSLWQVFQNEGDADVDDAGLPTGENEDGIKAKAWCINLTQLPDFRDALEPHNREYSLFVYATRPERADPRSPLKSNILPIEDLMRDTKLESLCRHLHYRNDGPRVDLAPQMGRLMTEIRAILLRKFFVVVKNDTPAQMINLYNRINSSGKRVEAEERAFARMVALYPDSWQHVARIFDAVHAPNGAASGKVATNTLSRDEVMERQKENRFGFKLFIRTFIQVSNYHLSRSMGRQFLSFSVVESGSFAWLMAENGASTVAFLWRETLDVLVTVRNVLRDELYCDDLAFLPDTMSLVPVFHLLIQYPQLREAKYGPLVGWAALSLLLGNQSTDNILACVARIRDEGEVAEAILPTVLRELHAVARHQVHSPETLEWASSIQNRYVLLLYGLVRRNGIHDFSYRNLPATSPLYGKNESAVCDSCCPQKQHIAPFSLLVQASGDRDAKRASSHPFNNIGNLTYISADLNHYDGGLGAKPVDLALEPEHNLRAHYLSDDGSHGQVGRLYDALVQMLGDKEGVSAEALARKYEEFCRARRHLIAKGFEEWLNELSRRAEETMASDAAVVKSGRMEAAVPQCIDPKYLPVTMQIRRLNYPHDIEDALVAYVLQLDEEGKLKKRCKNRDGHIELRLSRPGAIRLLLRPGDIRVACNCNNEEESAAAVGRLFGIPAGGECLYNQEHGGALSLDQLLAASRESERIDGLPKPKRGASKSRRVLSDEEFFTELKDPDAAPLFRQLLEFGAELGASPVWRASSVGLRLPDPRGLRKLGFTLYLMNLDATVSDSFLAFQLDDSSGDVAIADNRAKALSKVFGVPYAAAYQSLERGIPWKQLADKLDTFKAIMRDTVEHLKRMPRDKV